MNAQSQPSSAPAGLQGKNRGGKPPVGRRFQPGVSGNPGGRRRGSYSLKSTVKRIASRAEIEGIARKLLTKATGGCLQSIRLLADLLGDPPLPVPEGATIRDRIRIVSSAALSGQATIGTCLGLARILETESGLIDVEELGKRLAALEAKEAKKS